MKWTVITRHRAGTTFVLLFFLLFAALSGALLTGAARVYRGIDERAGQTHERTTPLACLAGAARRADAGDGVGIVSLSDGSAALRARENGADWLYFCRDGYLYKKKDGKPDRTAERLCAAGSLRLRETGGLLRADYTAPDGSRASLLLCPRSGGGTP